jgi:predicted nucleotidyltransferase
MLPHAMKVVQIEDLVALKLQALVSNPARGKDRTDIEELLRLHGTAIKMDVVREYAKALGTEHELEGILAAVARRDG